MFSLLLSSFTWPLYILLYSVKLSMVQNVGYVQSEIKLLIAQEDAKIVSSEF